MNRNLLMFKLLALSAALLLQTGCTIWTASWTGGIPVPFQNADKYPITSSIFGIRNIKISDDLRENVISYSPTNEITLNTNTTLGWIIKIPPADRQLACDEFYVLPKPAWWIRTNARMLSFDRTTCWTHFDLPKGAQIVSDDWGMYANDPPGKYEIAVFLDRKLAADFKFEVVRAKTK